eukprot:TRINITY_DN117449_c0_g1_i1.p1 TRINITY_DN117449_c0_g1~~TRINITY_DN117449_c0_g1_i1.p1  ORF type:complete len:211 (+),score=26.03 TRINITY_DN117449_c0_g1_i1:78-710(+)
MGVSHRIRSTSLLVAVAWICYRGFPAINFAGLQQPSFHQQGTQPRLLKHGLQAGGAQGDSLSGVVTSIQKHGATLKFDGQDVLGWLSRSQLTVDELSVGDKLDVKVLVPAYSDNQTMRVTMDADHPMFSKKPVSDLKPGDRLKGRVVRLKKRMLGKTNRKPLLVGGWLDVGYQSEGFLEGQHLKINDRRFVEVDRIEDGKLILRREHIRR